MSIDFQRRSSCISISLSTSLLLSLSPTLVSYSPPHSSPAPTSCSPHAHRPWRPVLQSSCAVLTCVVMEAACHAMNLTGHGGLRSKLTDHGDPALRTHRAPCDEREPPLPRLGARTAASARSSPVARRQAPRGSGGAHRQPEAQLTDQIQCILQGYVLDVPEVFRECCKRFMSMLQK
jgi:hypothetical protein